MTITKYLTAVCSLALSFFFFAAPTFAAAPDGLGPWADTVLSFHQGLMKNGLPVPAARSNPFAALGVAENDTIDSHFFSLGFGGTIALGFDGGISNGVVIVEATNPSYPVETAKVEFSKNGVTWKSAGQISDSGTVKFPKDMKCAKYIRITDTSNPAIMPDAVADGYDVDGVKAIGAGCSQKDNDEHDDTSANKNHGSCSSGNSFTTTHH